MKDREELLKEIALMLERQDMLSKLTENQCLDEYGYSETHCIDYIGRLELPNVTKVAEHMGMTRGAISKMTRKLLAKGDVYKRQPGYRAAGGSVGRRQTLVFQGPCTDVKYRIYKSDCSCFTAGGFLRREKMHADPGDGRKDLRRVCDVLSAGNSDSRAG